jgi:hypothetical protein
MEAVLALLTTSADQSGIEQHLDQNTSNAAGEESVIEHNGKKYQRI